VDREKYATILPAFPHIHLGARSSHGGDASKNIVSTLLSSAKRLKSEAFKSNTVPLVPNSSSVSNSALAAAAAVAAASATAATMPNSNPLSQSMEAQYQTHAHIAHLQALLMQQQQQLHQQAAHHLPQGMWGPIAPVMMAPPAFAPSNAPSSVSSSFSSSSSSLSSSSSSVPSASTSAYGSSMMPMDPTVLAQMANYAMHQQHLSRALASSPLYFPHGGHMFAPNFQVMAQQQQNQQNYMNLSYSNPYQTLPILPTNNPPLPPASSASHSLEAPSPSNGLPLSPSAASSEELGEAQLHLPIAQSAANTEADYASLRALKEEPGLELDAESAEHSANFGSSPSPFQ